MDDWRLTNQMDYLYKRKIIKTAFLNYPEKDHEHCSFCWSKFGRENDSINDGYCTEDANHWICCACFEDFKTMFKWELS